VLLAGDGTSGGRISADQSAGSCTGGRAGDITITSAHVGIDPAIAIEAGASVTANARCSAGAITMTAPGAVIVVAGLVESKGNMPGTGANQRPGGGPITIEAGCDLTVAETGRVSSRGLDPGADLVRLVGGCAVVIKGLVESTGPGHVAPSSPPNRCAGAAHPDKPARATACVEIVAGDSLLIDATGTNHGEVNADIGQSGGFRIAWIDILASGRITIKGASDGPYAVHANAFVSNSRGGIITVKSVAGKVSLAGQAIAANGGTSGGKGGVITVEAGGAGSAGVVDLGSAVVRARGGGAGTNPTGGSIAVRSFNGAVAGTAPGQLDASAVQPGSVTLQACAGVTYAGASTPPATELPPACGGAPALPASVTLPTCQCPVIPCEGPDCEPPCEGPDCEPSSFCLLGTVQAVLDPVTGRFPGNLGPDVVVDVRVSSLQSAVDAAADTNGDGYIIVGIVAQDGGQPGGSATQYLEVTRVYSQPLALIGCQVTLIDPAHCDGRAPVLVHAGAGSPEFPPGSGVTLYFQEIIATGSQSAPGWLVQGNGRFLEAVGSPSNQAGIHVVGDGNSISNSSALGNTLTGLTVQGNQNTISKVEARDNATGTGIIVAGDQNTVLRSIADGNAAGITVTGLGNLINRNKARSNVGPGFQIGGGTAASPNVVKNNVAGAAGRGNGGNGILLDGTGAGANGPVGVLGNVTQDNGANGFRITGTGHRLKDNASSGNAVCQYRVASGNLNATGNTTGNTPIAGANNSPFPTGCF
jgi:hypothetical protein